MLRCLALAVLLALPISLGSCASSGQSRELSNQEAQTFLKHVQIWVMSPKKGRASILRPPAGAEVDASLAVPISSDGYLLATAHGIPAHGVVLTLRDGENRPVYISLLDGKGPAEFQVVIPGSDGEGAAASTRTVAVKLKEQRLRVVKRFYASDLVLLKAPFRTPSYVKVLSSVPVPNEPVYFPSNPVLGEANALVLCPLDRVAITGISSWFIAVEHAARQGYSGTPMMNQDGELIALGVKSSLSSKHPVLWGSGLSKETLDEAMAVDRRHSRG
jgi:hypothetical protein